MVNKLHIDIETYSSVDIRKSGNYKYCESFDFEILMVAWAFNDEPIQIVDLANGEVLPAVFLKYLMDPEVEKHAHNAVFERQAFKAIGFDVPIEQWRCSAIKAAYCGLPISLEQVSLALKLGDKGKLSTGKALIRYFCIPCKPTKTNGMRHRNLPEHDPEKWEEFKVYCINDVEAEREIDNILIDYNIPDFERQMYILDQQINDRGILIDTEMAAAALAIDDKHSEILGNEIKELTGVDNPNSAAQVKKWLGTAMEKDIPSLAKDVIPTLIEEAESDAVKQVLILRQKSSKTSIKKYIAMQNCVCDNGRAHGLFQFYGANRTGRWAGRLIQLQNLPQNHIHNLQFVRDQVAAGDYDIVSMLYENVSSILSQLIRTAFIAKKGHTFAVADFSAIEARVIAWLSGEAWRMEVFNSHGKIYEASASKMFNIPIEQITKGSPERDKGKVAELALGYGGSLGALKKMGGEAMGLSDEEMKGIVAVWRKSNPAIVKSWKLVEAAAIQAIKTHKKITVKSLKGISFYYDSKVLHLELPSGRKLMYQSPALTANKWGKESFKYKGMDQATKKWWWVDTYGGKLIENIIQAIARDCLAYAMIELDKNDFPIVMHVHDEVVAEVPVENSDISLEKMCYIMGQEIPWAKGLPLTADGYVTPFYKKD